jgi:hypothetical protein
MATASHDALKHVLFDNASKHTELFRLTSEGTSQSSAYYELTTKYVSRLWRTFD